MAKLMDGVLWALCASNIQGRTFPWWHIADWIERRQRLAAIRADNAKRVARLASYGLIEGA